MQRRARAEEKVQLVPEKKSKANLILLIVLSIILILFTATKALGCDEVIINAKQNWLQPRTMKALKEVDSTVTILRNEYNVLLLKTQNPNFCKELRANKRKKKTKIQYSCSCNLPVSFYVESTEEIKYINDEFYDRQWNMKAVHADAAWTLTTGTDDSYVAVMDSGIDYDSIDIGANIWQKDYLNIDRLNHGTMVASVIASAGNDGYGLAGINWKTNVVPVKMLGDKILTYDIISGMAWIIDLVQNGLPIRAINASYGRSGFDQTEYDIIQKAKNAGIILVAAAGNDNINVDLETKFYPAAYELENIISVGSINEKNGASLFSNYGQSVDILAPGERVPVSKPGNEFVAASGTSFSAPHVAGAITLLDSYTNHTLTWKQLKDAILETAEEYPHLAPYAYRGRVLNVYAALQKYQFSTTSYFLKIKLINKEKLRVKVFIVNNITGESIFKVTRKRDYDVVLPVGFYRVYISNKNIRKNKKIPLVQDIFLTSEQRIDFKIIQKETSK